MVVLGDSHAQMWLPAFEQIGERLKWKVVLLSKSSCPAVNLPVWLYTEGRPFTQCTTFLANMVTRINVLKPNLLIVTGYLDNGVHNYKNVAYTNSQIAGGIASLLTEVRVPQKVVLGDIPLPSDGGPDCLAAHESHTQTCSTERSIAVRSDVLAAEKNAATSAKALFVDPTSWFCTASSCPAVIGNSLVYANASHITAPFADYVSGDLQSSMAPAMKSVGGNAFGSAQNLYYALAPLPSGSSAARIAKLVAASHKITKLPKNLVVPLNDIEKDTTSDYFVVPSTGCVTMSSCVYGSPTAKRSIVLFGDSHAWMWVPAVNPIAIRDKYRLILLEYCPAANVTLWDPNTSAYLTGCDAWRTSSIAALKAARPSLVLLASLTASRYSAPGKLMTSAQWRTGLESTISKLKSKSTMVVVLGDINTMSGNPSLCLAAYPNAVKKCATANPNPNPNDANLNSAEKAAAKVKDVRYLSTLQWLCTKTCSPIIGNMIAYLDNWHITATYAASLSQVMATDLAPLLKST
jgi:hypothetical protein